jgi:hypothetical protein
MRFIRLQTGDQEWRINEAAIACVIRFPAQGGCTTVRIRFIGGGEPLDIEVTSADEATALVNRLAQTSYTQSRVGGGGGPPVELSE